MSTAIEFNNISKQYRLGLVSTRTLSHDLNRWWQMSVLGKEDPFLKVGSVNDRSKAADSEYVWALKDIDFKVEQGDVVGIIGKNGAGKSTLLKLLSRVTAPTIGTIKAKGRIGSLLEVGTGFHSEMTGRENIYMNGAILGMTKAEITRKLDEIVDFSGCERYIDTPVKRYSSGMMVRLGFAVAAHLDPEILVVDEVLAVGDAEFQKKAIGKMKDISQGQGRTVLFVSHNIGSIRQLCNTGVLLSNGMVAYIGDVEQTVGKYLEIHSIVNRNIIDSATHSKPYINLTDITINGNTFNKIHVISNNSLLEIRIEGELLRSQRMSLEIRLTDNLGNPVAFFSPHHAASPLLPQGKFVIKESFELPKGLMSGNYLANMYLVNSCVEGLVDFPNAFVVECNGCATPEGYELSYQSKWGYIYVS